MADQFEVDPSIAGNPESDLVIVVMSLLVSVPLSLVSLASPQATTTWLLRQHSVRGDGFDKDSISTFRADPLTMQYPTAVQTSLSANAIFARFDPSGRFIATAQHQGSALIWDMDTKNAIRWLEGHVKPLTSME